MIHQRKKLNRIPKEGKNLQVQQQQEEERQPYGRYANLMLDTSFKRSFGSERYKRLLLLLLQELLPERQIVGLTYASQEHINPFNGNKDSRIDVECTDALGHRFVVEMQLNKQESFYDRAVLYSTYAVQQQAIKGTDNYFFPNVYFIGMMNFSFHKGSDQVLFKYSIRRDDEPTEVMSTHLQYLFLELPNCTKALTDKASKIDNICYAIRNIEYMDEKPAELDDEFFELLFDSAELHNFTVVELAAYELDMTTERDIRNFITEAKAEGRQEGLEKGRQAGLEEGRQEGEAIGLEKGRQEAAEEFAKKLLADKVEVATIVNYTGLTEEQIKALL